jgi:hypothetical protein
MAKSHSRLRSLKCVPSREKCNYRNVEFLGGIESSSLQISIPPNGRFARRTYGIPYNVIIRYLASYHYPLSSRFSLKSIVCTLAGIKKVVTNTEITDSFSQKPHFDIFLENQQQSKAKFNESIHRFTLLFDWSCQ